MKVLNVNDIVVSADNPFVQRDGDGNNIDDIVSLANDIKENGLIHTQIQKYITIAKKINTIPPEVLSDFDNKIISLNELYKIVTNSNKQEKISKNTNINEDSDNNTGNNVNVVSEKEHLLNNSEEDNVATENNPSEENVQDYENEKEDSSTSDFAKSENDIVEDNNANAEIPLIESEEDSLGKHNVENEKKSEKEHCVELLGKLCIAGKKSNPKNLIAGYPVVINDRYFLVPKNIGIDCIDEGKDKYRVNMYDIEPSTLKILQ